MYYPYCKRLFDLIISSMAILLSLPLFLVIVILLSIANKGNPFFFQHRPGIKDKTFKLIKFKTMNDKRDTEGKLLPDKQRITRVGSIIRSLSLDEIPQLWNVFKGDMSLIGPRPLLISYLPLYSSEQRQRHKVRPGITGWAQVNGRNTISWGKKFEYDVWYVNNLSFSLDIKILILTIKKVFIKEGINSSENLTMEPFKGNINKSLKV
jgi:undecaprenyl phosphate N,N'-diacetylbacillosamine 1-phosphate transferase